MESIKESDENKNEKHPGMPRDSREAIDDLVRDKIGVAIVGGMARNKKQGKEVLSEEKMREIFNEFLKEMKEKADEIKAGILPEDPHMTRQMIEKIIHAAERMNPTDEHQMRMLAEEYERMRNTETLSGGI